MRAFDLIQLLDPEIKPEQTKIHLASWNGKDDPLDLFRAGQFDPWQDDQNRRNFERDFVVALIAMPEESRWLFAGAYDSNGCKRMQGKTREFYQYSLKPRPKSGELAGRMVCAYKRTARQSYPNAENCVDNIQVASLLAERQTFADFPGYRRVRLSKVNLDAIVRHQSESWRSALSNVCGVYLITDEVAGQFYVGSAYGQGGFWQRWCDYSYTGHGGNVLMKRLIASEGKGRLERLYYSILETADIDATREDIIAREQHWKTVLGTRAFGLNAN